MGKAKKTAPAPSLFAMAKLYSQTHFLLIGLLGFSSGLPLLLTSSILAYWLRRLGIAIETIGLLSIVAIPYSLKFLWSPLLDKTHIPLLGRWLGQRRAMTLVVQLGLIVTIIGLGFTHPLKHLTATVIWATLLAFFSASQDMMIDGIRVELARDKEQSAAAAMSVTGYRLAMMVIGAGVPILSDIWQGDNSSWAIIFLIVAALQFVGVLAILACRRLDNIIIDNREKNDENVAPSLLEAMGHYFATHFWAPLADFFARQPKAVTLLLFLLFYKYGDALMGLMANPFYVDMGFTGVEIGSVVKTFGLTMTLLGGFIGGGLAYRHGHMAALWVGGITQAMANVFFVILATKGHDTTWLIITITADNISGGIGTAALVGFIGHLVNQRHSITQLALLTSFSAIGRNMLSTPAGYLAYGLGWEWFFVCR